MAPDLGKILKEFPNNNSLPVNQRVALLLDWAAKRGAPGRYLPLHLVVKTIMGYDHTPRLNNEEVERLRKNLGTVRRTLERTYDREMVYQPGIGVRATVDSLDVLKTRVPQRARRLASARAHLTDTLTRVDVKSLPATAEAASWKKWLTGSVQPAVKAINAQAAEQLMLPPGKE